MRKRILSSSLTACLALSSVAVVAADDSFSVSELAPIYRNYADPLYTSVGSFMGAGWSHTAEVHKFPGFDLTIGATFAKMPSSVGTFNLGNIGLDKTKYFGNGNTSIEKLTAPTFTNDGDVKALASLIGYFLCGIADVRNNKYPPPTARLLTQSFHRNR